MAGLTVHFEVLNQLNTPTLYADTLALRPAPAIVGRIFFRTDSPYGIYRDTGTAWDLVASPDTTGISGSGLAGQVPYFTGPSTIAGTNNFFWDSVNNRLGIATATPGAHLDVHGTGTIAQFNGTGTTNSFISFQNAGVGKWRLGNNYSGGTNYFSIFDQTNTGEIIKIESGTTALDGIQTLNAASFNNYTLTGIAAATAINNNRFISNYTFNAGITRTTIAEIGTSVNANMTFSGAFTKSNDGQQSAFSASLNFTLTGNFTQNQPATYLQTPTSIQSGATFTGAFTVSHFSNTRLAPWISATPSTITNAYQLVINNLSGFSGASLSPTYTNRWGIYQDGASDNNYFAGKLLLGTTTVGTQILNVNGTSLFQDSVQIGTNAPGLSTVRIGKNNTGGTIINQLVVDGSTQSDVTVEMNYIVGQTRTAASAFTLTTLNIFKATQATIGAGSTITSQGGFRVESTFVGATNNYGFWGDIPAGTNRFNIYMPGTANNYMAGSLGIGSTSLTGYSLRVAKNFTGATTYIGIRSESNIQSDVTSQAFGFSTSLFTVPSAFTLSQIIHYVANGGIGAGSTVTQIVGFAAGSSIGGAASSSYGFRGSLAASATNWNLYMDGTAANYMAGSLGIGVPSLNASAKVQIDTTTQGFLPPRMTTVQKNAIGTPAAGLIIFDTTLAKLCVYSGAAWETITSV